jgi:hypothetical protein
LAAVVTAGALRWEPDPITYPQDEAPEPEIFTGEDSE